MTTPNPGMSKRIKANDLKKDEKGGKTWKKGVLAEG